MKRIKSLFLIIFFIIGCQGEQFTFQIFNFPTNIPAEPGNNGWKYQLNIRNSTKQSGSMFTPGNRKIIFTLVDRNNTILLNDNFECFTSSIKANVNWFSENELIIELYEQGYSGSKDEYSRDLAKRGDKLLGKFHYKKSGDGEFILQ